MDNKYKKDDSLPGIVTEIWNNWQQQGGAGPCAHCPRHWSQRSDIPDQSQGDESNSYGMNPWYAEGNYNPDVVVMGEEPGYHDPDPDRNRVGEPFEQTRKDIREVANEDSGSIKRARPLFENLYDNDISIYWTNMTKCNPIQSNDNSDGQSECCGLSEYVEQSYLCDELEELDPIIVISLGGSASKNLLELYDYQLSNFTESTMAGEAISGFHTRDDHTAPFEIATALHPNNWFNHDAIKSKKPEIRANQNRKGIKKSYYGQYGDDLIEWISK